jgi:hypothetical protein
MPPVQSAAEGVAAAAAAEAQLASAQERAAKARREAQEAAAARKAIAERSAKEQREAQEKIAATRKAVEDAAAALAAGRAAAVARTAEEWNQGPIGGTGMNRRAQRRRPSLAAAAAASRVASSRADAAASSRAARSTTTAALPLLPSATSKPPPPGLPPMPPGPSEELPTPGLAPTPPGKDKFKSRSDRSSKFFFSASRQLFDEAASEDPARAADSASLFLPPLATRRWDLEDDLDDDDGLTSKRAVELSDDLLRMILSMCPASTLREAKAVDQRTHRIASELLRKIGRRVGAFKGTGRQKAHREVNFARWTWPDGDGPQAPRGAVETLRAAAKALRLTVAATVTADAPAARAASSSAFGSALRACAPSGGAAAPFDLPLLAPPPPPLLQADAGAVDRLAIPVARPPSAAPDKSMVPFVHISPDRLLIWRDPGQQGWTTCIVDRWHSHEVLTVALIIEKLSGPMCVGVVGLNYQKDHARGGDEPVLPRRRGSAGRSVGARWAAAADALASSAASWEGSSPLERSSHAIVCNAYSGRVFFKGHRHEYLAIPQPRVLKGSAKSKGMLLRDGCRLNVIVDAKARTLRFELLAQHGCMLVPESELEVHGLPAEVAVAVSLGPTTVGSAISAGFGGALGSGGESRVRLVGSSIDDSDVYDPGKTIKDLWDVSNVVKPLESARSLRNPDGPGAAAVDALAAEYMHVLASTAEASGW